MLTWITNYTHPTAQSNFSSVISLLCADRKQKQVPIKFLPTTAHAVRFRITQEIKFLYKKKQHLNQQLYRTHLQNAQQYEGMWQHIQHVIDEQLHKQMENQYQKLNRKLDRLMNSTNKQNTQKTVNFQPRIVNLSQTKFTKQQIKILSLGPNYALEKEPKSYIFKKCISC